MVRDSTAGRPRESTNVLVHAALIVANAIFGFGSIVGALGLPATNPLVFTTIREIIAGCLLLTMSCFALMMQPTSSTVSENQLEDSSVAMKTKSGDGLSLIWSTVPRSFDHFKEFCKIAFFLYCNQACYLVGLELAGPVSASIWQPSTPSLTALLAMTWMLEPWSMRRMTGVVVAYAGCLAMVLLADRRDDTADGGTTSYVMGNLLFLANCSSTACYILLSKKLLLCYPSLTVVGWSYILASVLMCFSALVSGSFPIVQAWICPKACLDDNTQVHRLFHISPEAFPALAYYVLAMSVGSWGMILWANQFATGTLVMGYNVIQPVTASVATVLFLQLGLVVPCGAATIMEEGVSCLDPPGIGALCGMAGVFSGLAMIVRSEPTFSHQHDTVFIEKDEDTEISYTEYGTLLRSASFDLK